MSSYGGGSAVTVKEAGLPSVTSLPAAMRTTGVSLSATATKAVSPGDAATV